MKIAASIIFSGLALSGSALAIGGVTSTLTAVTVERGERGERFSPAERAEPGDVVEYRLSYRNETDGPLGRFVAIGPVPDGTDFLAGTAEVSADAVMEAQAPGTDWGTPPLIRIVRRPDGTSERVTVPPSEYSALRWRLSGDLPEGAELTASYRVSVEN